jgi:PelA/Pel-15E family pectate lyase
MKLYDSDEKFCHCNLKSSLSNDMTISFSIQLKDCLSGDYKLIEKECEFLVKLSKKRKIYFYVADKNGVMKIQAKSNVLEGCEFFNVVIVRNTECKRTIIYINGKVDVSECLDEEFITISKACGDLCYFHGGECADYEMRCVKIFNSALNFDQISELFVWDSCNKKALLEKVFCNLYETYRFEDNYYYYIMTPEGIIFFPSESRSFDTDKKYPEYVFRYANIEQNEKCLPIDGLKAVKYDDLCEYFDVDRFITNLVTWQFLPANNDFQIAHPKNIGNGLYIGYWSSTVGLNPFTPYLDNVSPSGVFATPSGNLKNGFVVSFVKLILDQYLCTQNAVYRSSLDKLVDYLIALPGSGTATTIRYGIPDEYPVDVSVLTNESKVSFHQGNFLNYLKILDCLLENANIRNVIDDTRLSSLRSAYDSVMNLLLNLQVECGGKLSLWGEYYTPSSQTYTNITGDANSNIFLTVPESVEILSYLMNIKCPSSSQKKAIKNAIEWLKFKSLDKLMGGNYVQYLDDVSGKLVLKKNNYPNVPSQLVLHPHYYDYTQSCAGVGKDETGAWVVIDNTYATSFNDPLNTLSNQVDVLGTWAECVFDLYDEWVKIYDSPCNTNNTNQCSSKGCKSCKSCKHC